MPSLAGSFYLVLGSPNLPGQPLAQRIAAAHGGNSLESLLARVEGEGRAIGFYITEAGRNALNAAPGSHSKESRKDG